MEQELTLTSFPDVASGDPQPRNRSRLASSHRISDSRSASPNSPERPQTAIFGGTPASNLLAEHEGEGDEDEDEVMLLPDGSQESRPYQDFTTIDWIHDLQNDKRRKRYWKRRRPHRIPNWCAPGSRLYRWFPDFLSKTQTLLALQRLTFFWDHVWDGLQTWVMMIIIGCLVGFLSGFMEVVLGWMYDFKEGICLSGQGSSWYLKRRFCCLNDVSTNLYCDDWNDWSSVLFGVEGLWAINFVVYCGFAVLCASISFYLCRTMGPYACSSGLPEVKTIMGGFVIHGFLGVWTGIIKTIGVVFAVGSGLCLEKESPMVHIACCVGNIIPRFFQKFARNEAKKREVLSAAAAAGITVAFGSPIGGVLFSLEEVSSYFPTTTLWRSFFCSMIAAVTLQMMDPFRSGKLVLFEASYDRDWHIWELFCFILLGIFGGVFGHLVVYGNLKMAQLRRAHPFWTGQRVEWRDWVFWVKPSYRFLIQKLDQLLSLCRISSLSEYSSQLESERGLSHEYHYESGVNLPILMESRKWWNPTSSVARRYFQELLVVCLITAAVNFGHPLMRADMPALLGNLLRECHYDAAIVDRANPHTNPINRPPPIVIQPPAVPSNFSLPPEFAVNQPNNGIDFDLFKRSGYLVRLFVSQGSDESKQTSDAVLTDQTDDFGLCSQEKGSNYTMLSLLFTTVIFLTGLLIISFGLRVPGGSFIPAMVVGASFGRFLGMIVRELVLWTQSGVTNTATLVMVTPGTYALIGAAAALGGMTRLTVSVAVIVFEITGGAALTYIIPIMVALMTSKFVADGLDKRHLGGLSDAYIRFHGYPLLDHKRDWRFFESRDVKIFEAETGDLMEERKIFEVVTADKVMTPINGLTVIPVFDRPSGPTRKPYPHTVQTIERLLLETPFQGYPVVESTDSMVLFGYIRRADLVWAIDRSRRKFMIEDSSPCFFTNMDTSENEPLSSPEEQLISPVSDTYNGSVASFQIAVTMNPTVMEHGQFKTHINFLPWIDQSPLSIAPHTPMDLVHLMFKELGVRCLIVIHEGSSVFVNTPEPDKPEDLTAMYQEMSEKSSSLTKPLPPVPGSIDGVVTKKDVLKYIENQIHANAGSKPLSRAVTRTARSRRPTGRSVLDISVEKELHGSPQHETTKVDNTRSSSRTRTDLGRVSPTNRRVPIHISRQSSFFGDSSEENGSPSSQRRRVENVINPFEDEERFLNADGHTHDFKFDPK